jgi:hypothetical protein
VDLGREPTSQDRQVYIRELGLRLHLAGFGPLFTVVRPASGGTSGLHNGAVRAQLTPIDAALSFKLTL